MAILYTNNARTTVAAGGITNIATTLHVSAGTGALFPSPSGASYFLLTVENGGAGGTREIMKCTARATDALTVVRAQEGTAAAAWAAADVVELRLTAGMLTTLQAQSGLRAAYGS